MNRRRWKARIELVEAMSVHREIFDNCQRPRSALGILTPIEFENMRFVRRPEA